MIRLLWVLYFRQLKMVKEPKQLKGPPGIFVTKINKTTKPPVAKDYKEEITKALTDRKTNFKELQCNLEKRKQM